MKAAFDPRPGRASATGPNAVGQVPLTRMAPVELVHECGPDCSAPGYQMGAPKVNAVSGYCCGKPVGCTNPDPRCVYLQHPWKREHGIGEKP